jgi:cytoskeleton protein RodZ
MSDPRLDEQNAADSGQQDFGPVPQSPGAQLAALRQTRGWSIEQVASQLNLAPRQVQALESDDYPALPGMPIVRGFIRAYAKLLKVDPAPLLGTISGETVFAGEPVSSRRALSTFAETRMPSMIDRQGLPAKKIAIAALVVALLAGGWFAHQSGHLSALSGMWSSKTEQSAASVPGVSPAVPAPPGTASPPESAAGTRRDGASVASPAPAVVATAPSDAATPAQPADPGKDNLVLKLRDDSWVEIKRADNSIVVSRILKAGSTEGFEIAGPVSIVIGNAAAVEATLRGKPLDFSGNQSGNVARLNLK